jgi:molecular chaperone DnaJ
LKGALNLSKRDYYDVLGVPKGSEQEALKKAYRSKAKELHPDRNSDNPNAEAQFKEVNEAYEVLKDADKKAAYDRYGHAAFEGGGGGGRQQQSRGSDLRYNLSISLAEAFAGLQKTINVPSAVSCGSCNGSGAAGGSSPTTCPTCSGLGKVRATQGFFTVERGCPTCSGVGQIIKNPCSSCGGQGTQKKDRALNVNVPPGVETGTRIRLAGEGETGPRGGVSGDLYIFIEVSKHKIFERDGLNLFCRVPVSMAKASLGGEVEVPTIDGGRSRVRIPAGSQSGRQMRLKGKGMPAIKTSQKGDMFIEMAVETPVNLTVRQKELLEEFEQLSEDNNPETNSFFSSVKTFWESMKG